MRGFPTPGKKQCLFSTAWLRMDFANRPFLSEFLEDFSGPGTSLGVSHPVMVFIRLAVGSEGGRGNRTGNGVAKH